MGFELFYDIAYIIGESFVSLPQGMEEIQMGKGLIL